MFEPLRHAFDLDGLHLCGIASLCPFFDADRLGLCEIVIVLPERAQVHHR